MADTERTSRRVAQWTTRELDYWLDLFSGFCDRLLTSVLEAEDNPMSRGKTPTELVDQLKDAITTAGELTDHAVLEMQARGWTKTPTLPSRRKR
jgi:hypothetical protein